ncbi:MAG: hypothetical protein ACR2JW_16445 [Thermomicrobiales bacterium]
MTAQEYQASSEVAEHSRHGALRRRGLLAGAAALTAGLIAAGKTEPVSANTGNFLKLGDMPTTIPSNTNNYVEAPTVVVYNGAAVGVDNIFTISEGINSSASNFPAAIAGYAYQSGSAATGLYGLSNVASGHGVVGAVTSLATNGIGVLGDGTTLNSGNAAGTIGVQGLGNSIGVQGKGPTGVEGRSTAGNGPGVVGYATGVYTGTVGYGGPNGGPGVFGIGGTKGTNTAKGAGVVGQTTDAANPGAVNAGVYGSASDGTGVAGTSITGSGVAGGSGSATPGTAGGFFYTTANSGSGVVGQCFNPGGGAAAFVGAANAPNYAAFFTGDVVVTGNFVVASINGHATGGGKSAAVQHPLTKDTRLVYCVESPDAWFEDFGEGTLVNGKAEVKVDPQFMALIHTDSYHVFLTPHDAEHHLAVPARAGQGFTVAASPSTEAVAKGKKAADLSGTFSWRVVGKRSDTKLERLAKYTMPTITLPDKPLFDLTPPAPPKKG